MEEPDPAMNTITQEMKYRLSIVKYALANGVKRASRKYNKCRSYIYFWLGRYDGSLGSAPGAGLWIMIPRADSARPTAQTDGKTKCGLPGHSGTCTTPGPTGTTSSGSSIAGPSFRSISQTGSPMTGMPEICGITRRSTEMPPQTGMKASSPTFSSRIACRQPRGKQSFRFGSVCFPLHLSSL